MSCGCKKREPVIITPVPTAVITEEKKD